MDQHRGFGARRMVPSDRLRYFTVVHRQAARPPSPNLLLHALEVPVAPDKLERCLQHAIPARLGQSFVKLTILVQGQTAFVHGCFLCRERRPELLDVLIGRPQRRQPGDLTLDGPAGDKDVQHVAERARLHTLQQQAA